VHTLQVLTHLVAVVEEPVMVQPLVLVALAVVALVELGQEMARLEPQTRAVEVAAASCHPALVALVAQELLLCE
jgi:hypothetical protein